MCLQFILKAAVELQLNITDEYKNTRKHILYNNEDTGFICSTLEANEKAITMSKVSWNSSGLKLVGLG